MWIQQTHTMIQMLHLSTLVWPMHMAEGWRTSNSSTWIITITNIGSLSNTISNLIHTYVHEVLTGPHLARFRIWSLLCKKWAIPMFMKCLLNHTWQDFESGRFVVGARKHLASYLWQLAVFCIYCWFIFIHNIGFSLSFLVDMNGRATMRCTTILHLQH